MAPERALIPLEEDAEEVAGEPEREKVDDPQGHARCRTCADDQNNESHALTSSVPITSYEAEASSLSVVRGEEVDSLQSLSPPLRARSVRSARSLPKVRWL